MRNLDRAIAELLGYEVLDWRIGGEFHMLKNDVDCPVKVPSYSIDGNAMIELDAEMQSKGFMLTVGKKLGTPLSARYTAVYTSGDNEFYAEANTMPEAVAKAAYRALKGVGWQE